MMKNKNTMKPHRAISIKEKRGSINFIKLRKKIVTKIKELSLHLNELKNENKELRDRIREIRQRNKLDRELMLRSEVFMV